MKGLEAYKAIAILEMSAMADEKMSVERAEELREIIEKGLKALKIIVKILELDVNWAEQLLKMRYLSPEEYYLLKEVLL